MLRVTAVEPLDDHRLRVAFNDGEVREVDCSFLFRGTLGEPLRDPDYFRQVRVDEEARTVVWPNGLAPRPNSCTAIESHPRLSARAWPAFGPDGPSPLSPAPVQMPVAASLPASPP